METYKFLNKEQSKALLLTSICTSVAVFFYHEIKLNQLSCLIFLFNSMLPLFYWSKIIGMQNKTKDKKGLYKVFEKDMFSTSLNFLCLCATIASWAGALYFGIHKP